MRTVQLPLPMASILSPTLVLADLSPPPSTGTTWYKSCPTATLVCMGILFTTTQSSTCPQWARLPVYFVVSPRALCLFSAAQLDFITNRQRSWRYKYKLGRGLVAPKSAWPVRARFAGSWPMQARVSNHLSRLMCATHATKHWRCWREAGKEASIRLAMTFPSNLR